MPMAPGRRLGPYEIRGPLSGRAAWARSIAPATRGSAATSRSRFSPRRVRATPSACAASSRKPARSAALNHPNILAIYDVGTDDGRPFLVTELLEGETLRDRLDGGPLPLRHAVELAAPDRAAASPPRTRRGSSIAI